MARSEARIKCAIWENADFRALTLEAQWLYEAILTQKDLSLCGVLTWTPKRFAKLAANATASATKKALDLLREKRYVVLDEETDELWVRTFILNDRVLESVNILVGMSHDFGAIHSEVIQKGVLEGLGEGFPEGLPQRFPKAFPKGLPEGFMQRLDKGFVSALASARRRIYVPPASSLQPIPLSAAAPSAEDPTATAGELVHLDTDHPAKPDPSWHRAITAELAKIDQTGSWNLVDAYADAWDTLVDEHRADADDRDPWPDLIGLTCGFVAQVVGQDPPPAERGLIAMTVRKHGKAALLGWDRSLGTTETDSARDRFRYARGVINRFIAEMEPAI